jgi:inward rectifier potassium channel
MALFQDRRIVVSPTFSVEVRNDKRAAPGDWYHLLLRAPWWFDVLLICSGFLLVNVFFALAYLGTGGIVGAREGSFSDLFFFSVQTMATVGYGSMYPATTVAHVLSTAESLSGIFVIALVTGIVFSKFSVIRARVQFATHAVITPMDGIPTLMFRSGNERTSRVIHAHLRLVLTRTERTREGIQMYRMYDLKLERDWAPAMARSWTIMHRITPESPLYGQTPESFAKDEVEFILTLSGIDETSGQTLHAAHTYEDNVVRWGARHADMLTPVTDGLVLDAAKFDELIPTAATEAFPYPLPTAST